VTSASAVTSQALIGKFPRRRAAGERRGALRGCAVHRRAGPADV